MGTLTTVGEDSLFYGIVQEAVACSGHVVETACVSAGCKWDTGSLFCDPSDTAGQESMYNIVEQASSSTCYDSWMFNLTLKMMECAVYSGSACPEEKGCNLSTDEFSVSENNTCQLECEPSTSIEEVVLANFAEILSLLSPLILECSPMSETTCAANTNCTWEDEQCTGSTAYVLGSLIPEGCWYRDMYEASRACLDVEEVSCTGSCVWAEDHSCNDTGYLLNTTECELDGNILFEMLNTTDSLLVAQFFAAQEECAKATTEEACTPTSSATHPAAGNLMLLFLASVCSYVCHLLL